MDNNEIYGRLVTAFIKPDTFGVGGSQGLTTLSVRTAALVMTTEPASQAVPRGGTDAERAPIGVSVESKKTLLSVAPLSAGTVVW